MKVIDIHPEHLIDKLTRGALSGTESIRLEAHLLTCKACRLELELRGDYEGHRLPRAVAVGSIERRRRAGRAALGAGLLAAASTVAAVVVTGQLTSTRPTAAQPEGQGDPASNAISMPEVHAPQAPPRPAMASGPERQVRRTPRPHRTRVPTRDPAPKLQTLESASALFAAANLARRSGDPSKAAELYQRLQDRFPESDEATVALVTCGKLELHRGNATAALRSFQRYLSRPNRTLEAEALVGSATALSLLGRRPEEALAWKQVAQGYPDSAYAPTAHRRIEALGAL